MSNKFSMKLAASFLALVVAANATDRIASDGGLQDLETVQLPSGVVVSSLEDVSKDSCSQFFAAKKNIDFEGTRRILSLDGGGIRGLYEILELALLEEIINAPPNNGQRVAFNRQNNRNDDHYIRIIDMFDVVGGTSTGSILAAGLNSTNEYSASELLGLYLNHGKDIFDKYARGYLDTAHSGYLYESAGINNLLKKYFGDGTLKNAMRKPIYIPGFNVTTGEMDVFSNQNAKLKDTAVIDAVGASAAAPIYFKAKDIVQGKVQNTFVDGGLGMNNPAHMIYEQDDLVTQGVSSKDKRYELYSFGTGHITGAVKSTDKNLLLQVKILIENVFAAQSSVAEESCINAIKNKRQPLSSYFRIQPVISADKGGMDDTSKEYSQYALEKALAVTKGNVFKHMVAHLGFVMPSSDTIDEMYKTVIASTTALRSNDYTKLLYTEKMLLLEKFQGFEFDFYKNLRTKGGQAISPAAAQRLVLDLISDADLIAAEGNANVKYLSKSGDIQTMVQAGFTFHEAVKAKIMDEKNNINLVDQNNFSSNASIEKLAQDLITGFVQVCDELTPQDVKEISSFNRHLWNTAGKVYKNDFFSVTTSKYIDLAASLYLKNVLANVEENLSEAQVRKLIDAINAESLKRCDNISYTALGKSIRGCRGYNLAAKLADLYKK